MRLVCPHCDYEASIRTSRPLSDTVREASVQCNNVECAHTWVAQIAAVRTIAPSMTPKKGVYIPISPRSPVVIEAATINQGALDLGDFNPRAVPTG